MLEFCLLALACLALICGAFVEQIEDKQRQEFYDFLMLGSMNETV